MEGEVYRAQTRGYTETKIFGSEVQKSNILPELPVMIFPFLVTWDELERV